LPRSGDDRRDLRAQEHRAAREHPILKWCAANVVVVQDHNENVKPDKAKSTERIDLVSALVNALAVVLPAITGSVYDERPPLLVDL
jgi:phage terminase large subunit-like protein